MFKKIVLFLTVFGLACVAYMVYQWQDDTPIAVNTGSPPDRPARRLLASRPAAASQVAAFEYRGAEIQPGEAPRIRVFNPDGEARIVFQATKWQPLSDTEFHVTQPSARVLLPGGQLAYIRADEGQIVVQRDDKNNYNPKRGKLMGHVQLFIDRTRPEERRADPQNAEPEDHPEAVVKIWMDDVAFDLDLARLDTAGPIQVQSVDATIEGRGLTLVWNEQNRRIKLLRIEQGKRALVHMKSLVQLGVARDPQAAEGGAAETAPAELALDTETVELDVLETTGPTEQAAEEAAEHTKKASSIRLSDLEDTAELPKEDRVDTYQIVFRDQIVAEQRQGLRVVGRLKADMLELLRDFGSQERSAVEHTPASRPTDAAAGKRKKKEKAVASAAGAVAQKESTLELRWSGELVVTPVVATESQPATGDRFHVVAEGSPVELHDTETGDATCRRLEYRDESQEVWLIGSPEHLVQLQADAHRQLAGERVFLDRKNGIARVEGPGRMTDAKSSTDRGKDWPQCIKDELASYARSHPARKKAKHDSEGVLVTWKGGVDVRFALAQSQPPDFTAKGPGLGKGKEFLKSARFRGEVTFDQPGESMAADEIDITFAEPAADATGERSVAAESVIAQGRVRMTNDDSVITCDRLEVDMTTDDAGRNVPRIGRAFGRVVARQGTQEIQSSDQMVVNLESIPDPVAPEERERFEAAAKTCGYTPESVEWKAVQEKLDLRRRVVVRSLKAHGKVAVLDPDQGVDVGANRLECAFDDHQQIAQAFVIGDDESPAHVGMSDFYVRGPRITFRVSDQSAEVPGEGILRFFTKQDLSGRRVDQPVPVVVTWKDGMSFRGQTNTGLFSGSVRAVSEGTILDCRELSLRFESVPEDKTATQPAPTGADSRWLAGRVIDLLADRDDDKPRTSAAGISKGLRERLTHLHALGDAVIASSEYEKPRPQYGPFSSIMAGIMPDVVQRPANLSKEEMRLLSFVRISGPRITVNLIDEHLGVEGAGNLLVLDYRPPGAARAEKAGSSSLSGSMVGSLQSGGPSQTVFTWQNSMSYLNRRNVAVLDNRVVMAHVAGADVVMPDQVAAAMKKDVRDLTRLKSRRADLTCENLFVEFTRNRARSGAEPTSLSSATELKFLRASQRVRMQENNRSVEGEVVSYDSGTGLVRIQGSPQLPARIAELDEQTGAVPTSWRGQELEWNLNTGVVKVHGASIMAPGR